MKILLKHILRNIRQYKFRSALIVFSLAVSTMVMFLNLTIKDDITKKYTSVLQGAYQKYDIAVGSYFYDENGYFDLKDLDLSMAGPENTLYNISAYGIYDNNGESLPVILRGYDRQKLMDTELCLLEEKSSDFDSGDPSQIIVSRKSADKYGWKLGDSIPVLTNEGEEHLTITGIAKQAGIYLLEYDNIYIFTTMDFAEARADRIGKLQNVFLDLPEQADVEKISDSISEANEHFTVRILVNKQAIDSGLTTVNQLLNIILAMVIGLNLYIIASLTKLMMATRLPVVGTFRSIGATKGKMNFILILENAVFGLIGSAIGIGLGILVRKPMSGIFINAGDAFDYLNVKLEYKPTYFLYSILFSMGLQVLISLSSILKASRRSIKDNIFNTLSTMPRLSIKKTIFGAVLIILSVILYKINTSYNFYLALLVLLLALVGTVFVTPLLTRILSKPLAILSGKLFGGPADLGMKSISASKTIRSSITLITVGLSLVLMVYAATNSFNEIFKSFAKITDYDVSIYWLTGTEEDYRFLKDLNGIDRIDYQYNNYVNVPYNGKEDYCQVLGTDELIPGITGEQDTLAGLSGGQILVDDYYARTHDYKIGDKLDLEIDALENGVGTYEVAGFIDATYYTTQRNVIMMKEADFRSAFGDIPSSIHVYTEQDPDEIKNMLMKEMAGSGVYIETVEEDLAQQKRSNQSVINMATGILGLSVLLAVCGLLNNQMIGFIQRKREYAVLYSISMSRSQLKRMIFFEALGTFLVGGIFAVGLSHWMIRLLYIVLMSIGMGYPITLPTNKLLQVLGIVLLLLLITSISPMRKISKLKVIEEIKYE